MHNISAPSSLLKLAHGDIDIDETDNAFFLPAIPEQLIPRLERLTAIGADFPRLVEYGI